MFGVKFDILLINKLFTSMSPFVTGVLSDLIFFFNPLFLKSKETFPDN